MDLTGDCDAACLRVVSAQPNRSHLRRIAFNDQILLSLHCLSVFLKATDTDIKSRGHGAKVQVQQLLANSQLDAHLDSSSWQSSSKMARRAYTKACGSMCGIAFFSFLHKRLCLGARASQTTAMQRQRAKQCRCTASDLGTLACVVSSAQHKRETASKLDIIPCKLRTQAT